MCNKVFDEYGKYYDLLYKDKDYKAEAEYVADIIKKFSPNSKEILELGCGTGKHAKELTLLNYNVFGIDLSENMISKAKKLGVECEVGDVRNYRTEKKFDVVISLFHILSYQTTDRDVEEFFETARCHLKDDSILIFDVWYEPAVLKQLPEKRTKNLEDDEIKVVRFCEPNIKLEAHIVDVNYTLEILNKTNNLQKVIKETHSMRYFSDEEIKKFASDHGFDIILTEEWMTHNEPSEKTWGVCFVGRKIS